MRTIGTHQGIQAAKTPPAPGTLLGRIHAGVSVQELLRRGELGEQALGLLQLVAAQHAQPRASVAWACPGPAGALPACEPPHARQPHAETN
ncbi:MAG: hypothetical protein KatS3mg103_1447 [Phycisphaerales bacterium]|nr:MAG: hypothetical protein KatS3mg103_1447 [Phycisphaerales bacterium]